MIKLLTVGDPHIRGTNPRNRLDDYKQATKKKIAEVFTLAAVHEVDAIILPGDILDRPEVSTGVLLEFADLLAESPVKIFTTPGNHDLYSYNIDTYSRTSLAVMERIVPQLTVSKRPGDPYYLEKDDTVVQLTFTPYSSEIDRNGYGYSHEVEDLTNKAAAYETITGEPYQGPFKVHVAHGMLLDHTPPFDRFTLVQEVETNADIVITGHDHTGYGIYKRPDGKTFINLGSLTRLSASQAEIERTIQVGLITIVGKDYEIEPIPLQTAKPGAEVLDRSRIEAEQKRQYAMEAFSTLIQTDTGEAAVDVDAIIETIAKQEGLNEEVIKIALEKIAEQRGKL